MSNILKAHVVIKGTRPLLQHRFGADSIPLEKQERTGKSGNDPEEWRRSAMIDKNGQLFIEPTYIFGSLRAGAKYEPKKRGAPAPQVLVSGTLQITDDRIYLDRHFPGFPNGHDFDITTAAPPPQDSTEPVFLDVCGVINPGTRARNVRYRVGASTGWIAEFHILFDKTVVQREMMNAVVIDAGMFCGLGDGRNVGYGRFTVESFDVSE